MMDVFLIDDSIEMSRKGYLFVRFGLFFDLYAVGYKNGLYELAESLSDETVVVIHGFAKDIYRE